MLVPVGPNVLFNPIQVVTVRTCTGGYAIPFDPISPQWVPSISSVRSNPGLLLEFTNYIVLIFVSVLGPGKHLALPAVLHLDANHPLLVQVGVMGRALPGQGAANELDLVALHGSLVSARPWKNLPHPPSQVQFFPDNTWNRISFQWMQTVCFPLTLDEYTRLRDRPDHAATDCPPRPYFCL